MEDIKKIKLVVLDVDGVLTDGRLLIGSNGEEYKNFNVKDGMGISIAKYYGLKFAIITGRKSESVLIRSKELKIDYVFQDISNKEIVLSSLLEKLNLNYENVSYIGDDINDLPVLSKVGFSFAPNDAAEIVKSSVDFVTTKKGGKGVVREAIDMILSQQTNYDILVKNYLKGKEKVIQ